MNFNKTAILFLSFALVFTFVDAGTLTGHVKYNGKPPKKKRLRMDADPV